MALHGQITWCEETQVPLRRNSVQNWPLRGTAFKHCSSGECLRCLSLATYFLCCVSNIGLALVFIRSSNKYLTFPPIVFMFPWSNFIPMQIRRRGESSANPTRGSPLSVYSSHLAHVGGKVSVAPPQGVVCTALSHHMAVGGYAREPLYGGLSQIQAVHFSLFNSMVLSRPSNYFETTRHQNYSDVWSSQFVKFGCTIINRLRWQSVSARQPHTIVHNIVCISFM